MRDNEQRERDMRNMEWFSMNGVIRGMAINWSQGNEEQERESGYKK